MPAKRRKPGAGRKGIYAGPHCKIQVQCPEALAEAVEEYAETWGLSVSQAAVVLIVKGLGPKERPKLERSK